MKNKIKAYSATVAIMIWLTSCILPQRKNDYINAGEQAKVWGEQIIECFLNGEIETLKNLYCIAVKNETDLDEEILNMFSFFDGEIISYDMPYGTEGGVTYTKEDGVIDQGIIGRIGHVTTEKGTIYEIGFSGHVISKENEDNIGINIIMVRNVSLFDYYYKMDSNFYINNTEEVSLVEISAGVDGDER